MYRPRAYHVTLPLAFVLLAAALALNTATGARPVGYALMAAGALSILATAVALARRGGAAARPDGEALTEVDEPLEAILTRARRLAGRTDLPGDVTRDVTLLVADAERARNALGRRAQTAPHPVESQ